MSRTLGLTHATVSKSIDPDDPFVFHIHGLRENGDRVLVSTVDDEFPRLTGKILGMLQERGIMIEGIDLLLDTAEPEIAFMTMRDGIDRNGAEWTGLEIRFTDSQKMEAACFASEFGEFAEEMARVHPMPESFGLEKIEGDAAERISQMQELLETLDRQRKAGREHPDKATRSFFSGNADKTARTIIVNLPGLLAAVTLELKRD